jgi:hypothetical protein
MAGIIAPRFAPRLAPRAIALTAILTIAAQAAEPALFLKRQAVAGQEVLVRGFAEFDATCKLKRVQVVAIVLPPSGGRVDVRPGDVVIGPNWVGGGHCEGTTLPGVKVFYVPAAGFTGTDRFSLDIGYSGKRTVRADVEVVVR